MTSYSLPPPTPPTSSITPIEDELLVGMVSTLKDVLNAAYPDFTVVKTTRTYDAYLVPLTEFPLLKLYRTSDSFRSVGKATSSLTCSYCLANADLERMPGLTRWTGEKIVGGIYQFGVINKKHRLQGDISVQYRTISQMGELVYQTDCSFQLEA